MTAEFQQWLNRENIISTQKQQQLLENVNAGLNSVAAGALGTVLGSITVIVLLPVYTFLFLYYKTLILNFLFEIFAEENSIKVSAILQQTKGAIQNYMLGLLTEGLIVATLNVTALLIIGVKYALILGILGAIFNLLPLIGGVIGLVLALVVATVTQDGYNAQIAIVLAYSLIQFTDNHFLIPWIVSSRVKINALISIVAVFIGGMAWGITGMFISIPFTGILKLIFDRLPEMKPWGKLLGDEIPYKHKGEIWAKRRKPALLKKEQQVKTKT